MSQGTTKICSLKLFVDKRSHKVLFAEAPKEFVDLLFGLLSVPIGWAISLGSTVGKHVRAGSCLGNVYDSVEDFATTDLLPDFQNNKDSILHPRRLSPTGEYVKGTTAYMVLDDLTVKPMNTLSVVAITNKLKIEDVSNVDELVVDVGTTECSKLLVASLHSKTALTDVFLGIVRRAKNTGPRPPLEKNTSRLAIRRKYNKIKKKS